MKSYSLGKEILLSAVLMVGLSGCGDGELGQTNEKGEPLARYDVNMYALNKLVCDPFENSDQGISYKNGLKAELYYLNDSQPRYQTVGEYISHGTKSDQNLFFSSLNVPTRLFQTGFPTETGGLVMTDDDKVLEEYFALRFDANLVLGPDMEEGTYEFAMLSDDGSVFRMQDPDGTWRDVINNDGDHETKLGCSSITVNMTRRSFYPIQIDYYQGPRYHISLIPMWRKVDGARQSESLCGSKGNSLYFDFNNNSSPKQAYLDLESRGWRPIGAANYMIPDTAVYNPCNQQGQSPKISNFQVRDNLDGGYLATWTTDIPATAQVRYVNLNSGQETITGSDNVLRTSHSVLITGLQAGTNVQFQAISISADMGRSVSAPLQYGIE